MTKNQKKTLMIYLGPAVLIIVIFLYLPIILNFINSLYSWGAINTEKVFVGLENYTRLFEDEVFYTALKNNFLFAIFSVIFQIGVSFLIASVLESKLIRKHQTFFRTIYFIPSLLMVTVTGILFKMLFNPTLGLVNPLLDLLGINSANVDLLGNSDTAIYAVIAMSQWQYIGYTVILFIVAMQNIPEDLYEAAEIDGANAVQRLLRITLPQMKDTIMINMIIVVSGSIRVFDEVYVMTSGGPGTSTETLATYLYRTGFNNDEMGYASAIGAVIFLITFILGIFQLKGYSLDED
ncbi:carbohydrate ABC transporter permease [Claveliimonas bilis]|uniref:ABC transporter permease protein YurN n=1 Tax=Claveliimonas bilis TaxID=3028070 RepID=A0ABM8I0S8_9FIRM|nr:sugar ABC transporter permease [Claveliimonas bilis]MCQ5202320.1 sugar ABC transporter permease [Mordavella massiliensis]BDZ76332.1 putative ABC transporter permease protein YurN [Claveliimonas bilis]